MAIASGSVDTSPAWPPKYAVPSPPKETHGSLAVSDEPPVQRVKPGTVVRRHVFPPSREEATRSSRALYTGEMSCFQDAMRLRGLFGLTAIAGSTTRPVVFSSSWNPPGQSAANGLGPGAAVRFLTLYGVPPGGPVAAAAVIVASAISIAEPSATPERFLARGRGGA